MLTILRRMQTINEFCLETCFQEFLMYTFYTIVIGGDLSIRALKLLEDISFQRCFLSSFSMPVFLLSAYN